MYGYKAVLEAARRGDTYEKGIIPETPRIHCRQRTLNRNWKGLTRQKEKPVVNLVTPVAQALEMAKSELKRKGEDSITDRGRKTATFDWNSLRY